jgi:F-type H+-transporting ATPase subunit a
MVSMEQKKIFEIIVSPLDQFEIRDLFSVDTPLLGNLHISITNIGIYLGIATLLAVVFTILTGASSRITPSN